MKSELLNERYLFENTFNEEVYRLPVRNAIVITKPWNELKEEERIQLNKITGALARLVNPKLGLESFRVVFVPAFDLSNWTERPPRLIYFGPPVKGLTYYEVIDAAGTRMVLSDGLDQLTRDESSRAKLWQALQQLFSV